MATKTFQTLLADIQNNVYQQDTLDLSKLNEVDSLNYTDFFALANALKNNSQIVELNISYGKINPEVAYILSSITTLSSLILSEAEIHEDSAKILAQCRLKKLDISGNDIGNTGASAFENSCIEDLNLSGCNIEGDGAACLFKNPHINYLNLSCQGLTNESLAPITDNKQLIELNLINNQLTAKAMKYIQVNKSLKTLRVGNNAIGDKGIQYCAINPYIEELECTNTNMSDEGAKALAKKENLKKLTATVNNITSVGAFALYENPTLVELNLTSNKLSREAIDFYRDNRTHLTFFEFFNNPTGISPPRKEKNVHIEEESFNLKKPPKKD